MTELSNTSDSIHPLVSETAKYLVLGNVDSGKSSFIGVMEKNVLDDGNGYARSLIASLKHEKDSGRTSSHSFHYMVNDNRVTTLIDLCGHQKYLRTTIFGITGLFGNYGIVMIGGNRGVCQMTEDHMTILATSRIPFMIIINKIDICPEEMMVEIKGKIEYFANLYKKNLIYFEEEEKLVNNSYLKEAHFSVINSFQEDRIDLIPVIMISNKTGYNVDFVRELITTIKSSTHQETLAINQAEDNSKNYPPVMYIDNVYVVKGVGTVLSGTVKYGELRLGQKVYLGPIMGKYIGVTIKSVHNCISQTVDVIPMNESGSISIRLDVKKSYCREIFSKGQIVTPDLKFAINNTCYDLFCRVRIYKNSTSIRNNYQPVIHCGTIHQVGCFELGEKEILRSGSLKELKIRFMKRPEFVLPNTKFIFRDGNAKGIGLIISTTAAIQNNQNQNSNKKY